jgi:hypothetical protein
MILPKNKPVAISQLVDWEYMEHKNDTFFNQVVVAFKAKNLRDVMAFQKHWNNEIIAQFYATLYVKEHGDTRKLHWMIEGQWFEVTYAQFARLLGFGRLDADRPVLHFALKLDTKELRFMYPSNKRGSAGTTTNLLPFYAYMNHLFRRMMTPREGDSSKILGYNRNILAAMAPNGLNFSVFDFIWEEIKAILNNPLKSCGYAPFILHMLERVTNHTFGHDKEHHSLRIKNDLKAPVEERRAAAPQVSSHPRATTGRGQQGGKPPSPIRKMYNLIFRMCKSQHAADVKAQHER